MPGEPGSEIVGGSPNVKVRPGLDEATERFRNDSEQAIKKYEAQGGKVTWDNNQPTLSRSYWSDNAFHGTFNVTNPQANKALGSFVEQAAKTGGATQSDLIYKALELNNGNLPDAYASLATVFSGYDTSSLSARGLADKFDGVAGGGGKDYYKFLGAFFEGGGVALGDAAFTYDAGVATAAHAATAPFNDNTVVGQLKAGGEKVKAYSTGKQAVRNMKMHRAVARLIDFTQHLAKPVATVKSILVNSVPPLADLDPTLPCPVCKKPHLLTLGTDKVLFEGRRVVVEGVP